ncbi:MAG TPA: hypothetical protein VH044_16700, partial [Polyangiaceae bacterium]|nr:hypothetical protein [Polyangiaceae bacterium]
MVGHDQSDPGTGAPVRSARPPRGRIAAASIVAVCSAGLWPWACGGTTGHPGEVAADIANGGMDATVEASAGDDDASYDTGAFDVAIQYADRELPDVAVPPEAGAMVNDGGFQPSDCPPWVALDSNGHAVTLITDPTQPVSADLIASVVDFVPADYAPEGGAPPGATFATTDGGVYPGVVPAADGGVCATYPYYFPGFDENCLIQGGGIAGGYPYPPAPPCNWALNLGMAQSGPGAVKGLSRYRLCVNL